MKTYKIGIYDRYGFGCEVEVRVSNRGTALRIANKSYEKAVRVRDELGNVVSFKVERVS